MAGGAEGVAGLHGQLGDVGGLPRRPPWIGQELQRGLQVLGGLVGRTHLRGLAACSHRGVERGVEVHRRAGVPGQLGGGAGRGAGGEGGGVGAVQPDPLPGQQVVVDGLAEQRVPERVVAAVGDEDVEVDRTAQTRVERGVVEPGDRAEHLVADPAPGHAGRAHHLTGGVVEAVEPDEQHIGQVDRELVGATVVRHGGADQLLDEERVALGAGHDVGGHRAERRLRELGRELGDQVPDGALGQRAELDPADVAQSRPLGDLTAQRVAAVQVVGAVGDHQAGARDGAGEEEGEHVAGRLVGPVGVLDHEQERSPTGGLDEQDVQRLEEFRAVQGAAGGLLREIAGEHSAAGLEAGQRRVDGGDLGDEVGLVGGEAPEDLGEGEVRQGAVAEVEAVPGDDLPALGEGDVAQLRQQPGLAHPGVAAEQDRRGGATGAGPRGHGDAEQGAQLRQLGVSADHDAARGGHHGGHDRVSCHRVGVGALLPGRWVRHRGLPVGAQRVRSAGRRTRGTRTVLRRPWVVAEIRWAR